MENVPNNLDDYGFLTLGGVVLNKSYASHSVDDILLDVSKDIKSVLGTCNLGNNDAKQQNNGVIHSRLSSSQPSLHRNKKAEQRTIRVKFEIEDLHLEKNGNLQKGDKNITKKDKITDVIDYKSHHRKKHWWRSVFSSKSTKNVKTHEQNHTSIRKYKSEFKDRDVEIIEDISFSEFNGRRKSTSPNESAPKSRSHTKEGTDFKIGQLTMSPNIRRRASADDLLSQKVYHANRVKTHVSISKVDENSRNSAKKSEHKKAKMCKLEEIKSENAEVLNKKEKEPNFTRNSVKKKKKSKFSFRKSEEKKTKNDKEKNVQNTNESTQDNKVSEETQIKRLYLQDESSYSSVYEKFPAQKMNQRKVLVHIHTKEEMPISNGIPQWMSLSYQYTGGKHCQYDNKDSKKVTAITRRNLIRPGLLESSFVGGKVTTSVIDQTGKYDTVIKENTPLQRFENPPVVTDFSPDSSDVMTTQTTDVLVHEIPTTHNHVSEHQSSENNKIEMSVTDGTPGNAEDNEVTELKEYEEPSYFEVSTDGEQSPDKRETLDRLQHNTSSVERGFALTGMATDKLPDVIARKHPYLASSKPLRHMAKCMRQAPLTRSKSSLSPTNPKTDMSAFAILTTEEKYRANETNTILERMKERVQRLEVLSDESKGDQKTNGLEKQSNGYHITVSKSFTTPATSTPKMLSLPLPCVNLPYHVTKQNKNQDEKFRKLISRKIRERNVTTHSDGEHSSGTSDLSSQTHSGSSGTLFQSTKTRQNTTGSTDLDEASVFEIKYKNISNAPMPTMQQDPKDNSQINPRDCASTTQTNLNQSFISKNKTEILPNPQITSSPSRRRLRIIPFTLPFPGSTRYNSDGLFGESQFGVDESEKSTKIKITPSITTVQNLLQSSDDDCSLVSIHETALKHISCNNSSLNDVTKDTDTHELDVRVVNTETKNREELAKQLHTEPFFSDTASTLSCKSDEESDQLGISYNARFPIPTTKDDFIARSCIGSDYESDIDGDLSVIATEYEGYSNIFESNTNYVSSKNFDACQSEKCNNFETVNTVECNHSTTEQMTNTSFQQEEIKNTILNEMNIVRSRYSHVDANEINTSFSNEGDSTFSSTDLYRIDEDSESSYNDDSTLCNTDLEFCTSVSIPPFTLGYHAIPDKPKYSDDRYDELSEKNYIYDDYETDL